MRSLISFLSLSLLLPLTCFAQGKANPDISVNFLGLYLNGNGVSDDTAVTPHKGASLQEAELQITSDVDAYLRAKALFAIAQEEEGEYAIEPEEVYLETTSIPSLTVRAGKFKMALGKHNQLHTHAFPFIDAPLIHQKLLGDEGLNETGVSGSALLPTPWFSEITVQAFGLKNEELYNSPNAGETGGLASFKNLWDLSPDLTLEVGLATTRGQNQFKKTSTLHEADLTFKWRPSEGGKYRALIWSTEYLEGHRPGLFDTDSGPTAISLQDLAGVATWVQYQFAQRWWVQARYEHIGTKRSSGFPIQEKQSYLVGFFPSEFSGFRLQYDHLETRGMNRPEDTIGLQYNITIGAHPAHAY